MILSWSVSIVASSTPLYVKTSKVRRVFNTAQQIYWKNNTSGFFCIGRKFSAAQPRTLSIIIIISIIIDIIFSYR